MKYFLIPGRKWPLSLAELRTILSVEAIQHVELSCVEGLFLFDIQLNEEEFRSLFHRLGGFIKCGKIINEPITFLQETYADKPEEHSQKVNFAISFYGVHTSKKQERNDRHKLGMTIKKWLSDNEISSRYVSKRSSPETSLVLLNTNKIFESGFELNRLIHPKSGDVLWGQTLAVQDYEGFSKRDYSRPAINKAKGMIPPKLARIMVNLAGREEGTVWDPFCGSGTILMEALLLGHKVVGTDIDGVSIDETKRNLKWLCDEYWISHQNYAVFKHDITDGMPDGVTFDTIVSEPFLGPVLKETITVEKMEEISRKILPLYAMLEEIVKNNNGGTKKTVVIVIPGFRTNEGWIDMDVSFSGEVLKDVTNRVSSTPLQWDRPNSIIRRNIKVYESV